MDEITFGPYAVPVILSVLLGLVYKVSGEGNIPDRIKPLIAILFGIALGLLSIGYEGIGWTMKAIVDRVIHGLMTGASAVGLYEIARTAYRPRE